MKIDKKMSWGLENSILLRCLKKIGQSYRVIEEKIGSIYLNSFTHRLIGKTVESIKIGFKYSVFGRLTQVSEDVTRNFFQTSKTMEILLNGMRNLEDKLIASSATSSLAALIRNLKCDFLSKSLKVGGTITITAIAANVILSVILQKHINLVGWLMRVLLLFIGINGLFCNVDWLTLKTNSIFFKRKIAK